MTSSDFDNVLDGLGFSAAGNCIVDGASRICDDFNTDRGFSLSLFAIWSSIPSILKRCSCCTWTRVSFIQFRVVATALSRVRTLGIRPPFEDRRSISTSMYCGQVIGLGPSVSSDEAVNLEPLSFRQ